MRPRRVLGIIAWALPIVAAQGNNNPLLSAIAKFPECAGTCLGDALEHTICTNPTNETCVCADQKLRQTVTTCVTASCTVKEALFVGNLTSVACNDPVHDKNALYTTVTDTLGIISGIFVIQRFGYKLWAKLDFGPDDWFCLATIVSGVPSTVLDSYGIGSNGIGRDVWTVTYDQITDFGRSFFIVEVLYFFQITTLKLSLLFFYIRIFPAKRSQWLLWGTVIFASLFGVAFVIAAIFQCTPVSYFWTKWDNEHKGTCMDLNALAWSNAAISISLDACMLAIPLWELKNLQLNWKRKVGVALMFCVGTFVTVVSILRLQSLVKFGADSLNPTREFFDVALWSDIEINVGIICACMPSLRLLLVRLFPKFLSSTRQYNSKYGSAPKSNTERVASRRYGTTTSSSRAEHDHRLVDLKPNQITLHTTYDVEYGHSDADERQLVGRAHEDDMRSWGGASEGSVCVREAV